MWTLATIAEAVHGTLYGPSVEVLPSRVVTDTRTLRPKDVFVALRGERFDGHEFVEEAVRRGASAVVVERLPRAHKVSDRASVIVVKDTLQALGDLARCVRQRFSLPVVGITGSNGKTSTKEMTASILARRLHTLKNPGNFNNLIGVPLTLLQLTAAHDAAVVEMGINVVGEMERLVSMVQPTVGIITNIHPTHLEGLRSLDTVLSEKGKLWTGLPEEGTAIVNGDDGRLRAFAQEIKAHRLLCSVEKASADFCVEGAVTVLAGESRFRLATPSGMASVRLAAMGKHHVLNALMAAAAAYVLGFSVEEIQVGLEDYRPVKQRMVLVELQDGMVLVDDTYNANPMSMVAAFRTIKDVAQAHPLALVLGEMRELGESAASWHQWVGEQAAKSGPTVLVVLGAHGQDILDGAQRAGYTPDLCFLAANHEEAAQVVLEHLEPKHWILVKGSRGMTMERVVEKILERKGLPRVAP
ncbi:UDP-N-acetylmuramoyl-tripeptide--D-alanyl-D-alanine ligase [Desulfosoma caldarium]|uniref:UDP-N-acetylmuramoyl-tripeptide--D-alanyl-D-alanine ligase n=1 Tax=Desulfosoma caldarium TaxID=610254 RepID=A0A3N1UX39_9BACT|nr:UDP-N-acetylmuramoyl-tripeptide--D-alanyl-D-alanine ligase [Desulfosoma caldarium]ROQ93250.1 UDP-N-acetylmuramoyl-tripeptide--D-alanyl-D-alanine ligase [Desulfosoma caldarium]